MAGEGRKRKAGPQGRGQSPETGEGRLACGVGKGMHGWAEHCAPRMVGRRGQKGPPDLRAVELNSQVRSVVFVYVLMYMGPFLFFLVNSQVL